MISKAGNTVSLRTSGSTVNATSGRVSMGSSGRPDGGREDKRASIPMNGTTTTTSRW